MYISKSYSKKKRINRSCVIYCLIQIGHSAEIKIFLTDTLGSSDTAKSRTKSVQGRWSLWVDAFSGEL